MCGFVGFCNFKDNISNKKEILEKMNNTLSKRGPDEEGYYINSFLGFGHKRLIVIDKEGRKTTYERKLFFWRFCYFI